MTTTVFKALLLAACLFCSERVPAQSWMSTSAPAEPWTSIACSADGFQLIALTDGGGIYTSTNHGQTWNAIQVSTNSWGAVASGWSAVAMSQSGSKAVAVSKTGIAYSTTSGASWHLASTPAKVNWSAVAGSADGRKWVAAAPNVGVFCSADSGATWQLSSAPTNLAWSTVASSADGAQLTAAVEPGLIYISTNAGATWAACNVPALSWKRVVSSADGDRLVAATLYAGVYVSTNGGCDWRRTAAPTNDTWWSAASSADGSMLMASAFYGGIYSSTNGGTNWAQNSAPTNFFYSLCSSADGSELAAAAYGGSIWIPGVPAPTNSGAGQYQGLFFETNGIREASSGFISISISAKGKYSAKLQLAGKSYSFSGILPAAGSVTNVIKRAKSTPLTVSLGAGSAAGELGGWISDGVWTAPMEADLAAYSKKNAAPQAGKKYTLGLPDSENAEPQMGAGFGSITVDATGKVSIKGTLGEGTKLSQSTYLSSRGQWPFYAALYSGGGSILGWLTFTNETDRDIDGAVIWLKPAQTKAGIYRGGFTNEIAAIGSFYTNTTPALNLPNAQAWFASVNGMGGFTNRIKIGAGNTVTNLSSNSFKLSLADSTGLFSGSAVDPATRKKISFYGAVLQKPKSGMGYFLGTNQSGSVHLGAAQ